MATKITMSRKGQRLECVTPWESDMLDSLPEGKDLNVTITQSRSTPFNALYWAGLTKAVENMSDEMSLRYPTPRKLHSSFLMALGFFTTVWTFEGVPVVTPDSIAFDKMNAVEFKAYFDRAQLKALEWLKYDPWETLLKGE